MQITEQTLTKIEQAFDISLYDWQRDYLLGKSDSRGNGGRASGRTFAFIVRLLLANATSIEDKDLRIGKYIDEHHGHIYVDWFRGYVYEINEILVAAGLETKLVTK